MTRSRMAPPKSLFDREWPYQVALKADFIKGKRHAIIEAAKTELGCCPRGHAVRHDDIPYVVFCFSEQASADEFQSRFNGEPFDPKDHGPEWWRWRKPDLVQRRKPMLDAAKKSEDIVCHLQAALALADIAQHTVMAYLIQLALDEARRRASPQIIDQN